MTKGNGAQVIERLLGPFFVDVKMKQHEDVQDATKNRTDNLPILWCWLRSLAKTLTV